MKVWPCVHDAQLTSYTTNQNKSGNSNKDSNANKVSKKVFFFKNATRVICLKYAEILSFYLLGCQVIVGMIHCWNGLYRLGFSPEVLAVLH